MRGQGEGVRVGGGQDHTGWGWGGGRRASLKAQHCGEGAGPERRPSRPPGRS